jgi:hypothetical protein
MELYKTNNYIYYKYKQIREHNNNQNILFKDNYMKILNVRDILINQIIIHVIHEEENLELIIIMS